MPNVDRVKEVTVSVNCVFSQVPAGTPCFWLPTDMRTPPCIVCLISLLLRPHATATVEQIYLVVVEVTLFHR